MAAEGGGGWLSGLLGGGGGGSSTLDLYGDLFSPEQKKALEQREMTQGLFRMAETLGKMAQPSRAPPGLGGTLGALGAGLGAFGGGTGEETALKAMEVAEKVKESRQTRAWQSKINEILMPVWQEQMKKGLPLDPSPASVGAQASAGAPAAAAGFTTLVPGGARGGSPAGPPALADLPWVNPAPGAPGFPSTPNPFGSGDPSGLPEVQDYSKALDLAAPPAAAAPSAPPLQNTGLLGPPDQVVGPDGQPLPQGVLPNMLASLTGGMPGGRLPFRLASAASQTPGAAGGDVLDTVIAPLESGNRNIKQQILGPEGGYNPSVGRVTGPSSAQGYYQITNQTWQDTAPKAGVDLDKYPTAMSAPREVQKQVAQKLLETRGLQPWADFNPAVAAATGYQGGGQDTVIPSGPRLQRGDLRNAADTGAPAGAAGASGVIPGLGMTPEALGTLNALMKINKLGSPFDSLLETYYKSPGYLGEKARTEATAQKGVALEYDPKIAAASAAATQKYIQENATHQSALDMAKDLVGKGVYLNKETGKMEPILNAAVALAEIDRVKEQNKADLQLTETTLTFPGEAQPRTLQMTGAQARAVSEGRGVPELGIPAMTGIKLGKPVEAPEQLKQQEIDQKFLEEKRVQAESSRRAIMAANDTRSLIEKGVIAGTYADERTRLLKLGQLLNLTGKDDNERIKNTETYIANLGRGMKEGLKGLGPPVSNVDIQVAEKIAGGQNLTTQGMLELLKLEEKYHRLALQDYGKLLTSAPKSRYDKSVKEPPTFGAPIADDPNGVAHWHDGKTWRPL